VKVVVAAWRASVGRQNGYDSPARARCEVRGMHSVLLEPGFLFIKLASIGYRCRELSHVYCLVSPIHSASTCDDPRSRIKSA
jgi:hypothetical protein